MMHIQDSEINFHLHSKMRVRNLNKTLLSSLTNFQPKMNSDIYLRISHAKSVLESLMKEATNIIMRLLNRALSRHKLKQCSLTVQRHLTTSFITMNACISALTTRLSAHSADAKGSTKLEKTIILIRFLFELLYFEQINFNLNKENNYI